MKKSLLALAALTAFAGAASAQSSVTLFGIVDLAAVSVKNGSLDQKLMSSNQLNSNRLGFRGVEDLGGGLRAGFWLESAMANDTGLAGGGSTGLDFQRRSTVSLMGGFGELRLGRDYTPSFWNYTIFDPFGTNGPGGMSNVVNRLGVGENTFVRANNSIGYHLPALGGLYGQVMVAAAEGARNGNKYVGGRIGYAGGPVNIAAAIGVTDEDSLTVVGDDYTDANIGGSFRFGAFTLMAQYSKRDHSTRDQKTVMVGGLLSFGQNTLKASYTKSDGAQGGQARDVDADQIALGYQYDLSKRTALYGTVATLDNEGTAATGSIFTIGSGPALTTGGQKSRGFAIGVRHSF
jgi:predicted porin